jgi:hypothetical protein
MGFTCYYYPFHDIVKFRSIATQRLGKHIPTGTNVRNDRTSAARQRINEDV